MADDDTFVVGAPLPRIAAAEARDGLRIVVTWASDGPGAAVQVVDLAPAVFRYKLYAPLRDDSALFRAVRVTDDGFALAWGEGDDLDMASTTLAELAEQAMTPDDFGAFMKRNGYTLDSVAAELGISRRLAAYYAKDREIPRAVALACRYLDKGRLMIGTPLMNGTVASELSHPTLAVGNGVLVTTGMAVATLSTGMTGLSVHARSALEPLPDAAAGIMFGSRARHG